MPSRDLEKAKRSGVPLGSTENTAGNRACTPALVIVARTKAACPGAGRWNGSGLVGPGVTYWIICGLASLGGFAG